MVETAKIHLFPWIMWDGLMKIVSFIYEHRVIKKILAHLGLSEEAKSKRERAPPYPKMVETIIEPYDDGWPDYEEPFIEEND
jgi:hypothetical protein